MLAKKIIESLNVSPIYFIIALNLSQKLPFIAGIRVYDCKPIQIAIPLSNVGTRHLLIFKKIYQ